MSSRSSARALRPDPVAVVMKRVMLRDAAELHDQRT